MMLLLKWEFCQIKNAFEDIERIKEQGIVAFWLNTPLIFSVSSHRRNHRLYLLFIKGKRTKEKNRHTLRLRSFNMCNIGSLFENIVKWKLYIRMCVVHAIFLFKTGDSTLRVELEVRFFLIFYTRGLLLIQISVDLPCLWKPKRFCDLCVLSDRNQWRFEQRC